MSVRAELNIPAAASFAFDTDGGTHILSLFGDTWCTDEFDEDTGTYVEAPVLDSPAKEPETIKALCAACRKVAESDE